MSEAPSNPAPTTNPICDLEEFFGEALSVEVRLASNTERYRTVHVSADGKVYGTTPMTLEETKLVTAIAELTAAYTRRIKPAKPKRQKK